MANTLTGLIPTLYSAMDVVSRELVGLIPAVSNDMRAAEAAVGQTVRSPVVPAIVAEDITPGATPADSGDQEIGYVDMTISKARAAPVRWTGEEQKSLQQNEFGQYDRVLRDQFTQAMRVLVNEVEADLAGEFVKASRAVGTAGTTPFATKEDMSDLAEANRILDENGAPATDRQMVVGSLARSKLEGTQSQLFKVNEAGDAGAMLRERELRRLSSFTMGYSAGIQSHVKGTGTGYDAAGGEPVGETTIALDGGTAGATGIKAGDVVTFAGDDNKYVVTTGQAGASGNIVLAKPGMLETLADTVEMTIGNSYVANMFFSRNAIHLATRAPAMPQGGDDADDVTTITDPVSGLTFQVALYKQYRQIKYEVGLAWGWRTQKAEHLGILMG